MKVVRKFFLDCEKEEAWLNEMSAEGFALLGVSGGKYVFENSQPGEYIYRIVGLDRDPNHPASLEYLQFLKGTNIEHITSDLNWVYLRKESADGAFEVYSDIDSKLKQYRKANLVSTIGFGFALISLLNVCSALLGLHRGNHDIVVIVVVFAVITGFFGIWILKRHWYPLHKKRKALKKDKMIVE